MGSTAAVSWLSPQRADGYADGENVFQGVRAYDPDMNQWTTPDAYAGDVHDPMSQKPYIWNDNNPVEYADPSGYDPVPAPEPAPAPDFQCGSCAPVDNSGGPIGDGVITALSLFLPGGIEGKVAEKLGVEGLIKAAADRFAREATEHGLTAGSEKLVIQSSDKVKIQYRDADGVRRDVMAHNEHPGEPGTGPHTQTATKGKTDKGSHQPIPQ